MFPKTMSNNIARLCRMVKIEHSVFALPFAFTGAFMAANGWPGLVPLLWLSLAMVSIRSFAMAVNRVVDLPYDTINPRTQNRALVTKELSLKSVLFFIAGMAALFGLACWGLNPLCLQLAPAVLVFAAVYSLTKRITWLCHFVLGGVLALAPIAGWLAVSGSLAGAPLLLAWAVLFWVAGFDILYSAQDIDFDIANKLFSIPAQFGLRNALHIAAFCHVNTSIFLLMAGPIGNPYIWFPVWGCISLILFIEHKLISPADLSKVNLSFFVLNGIVAALIFAGALTAIYWN